jgi:hypothetical protein
MKKDRQVYRQTGRQVDRQTGRKKDRQTYKHKDKPTDRWVTETMFFYIKIHDFY